MLCRVQAAEGSSLSTVQEVCSQDGSSLCVLLGAVRTDGADASFFSQVLGSTTGALSTGFPSCAKC